MVPRRLRSLPLLILLLAAPVFDAPAAQREDDALPAIENGNVILAAGGSEVPIAYSRTTLGPLFALPPIVARLGGTLDVGPLGQAHKLVVEQQEFIFGTGSPAITVGEEILQLSQPPAAGPGGLMVPLDLLRTIYGERLGYDFSWEPAAFRLAVGRIPAREVEVAIDLVHLQGVSTLVLQFPFPPRYRVARSAGVVDVELIGDRLRPGSGRALPPDPLVKGLEIDSRGLRLRLAPGTEAEDYVLQKPFRLVFDVYRAAPSAAAVAPPPRPQQRTSGIRTIVLDPGHGGGDLGAVGPRGSLEKDLTLRLARALGRRLESRMPVKVVLTRGSDAELPLDTRASLANQQKADLFISLHLNSSPEPGAQGAETYFSSLEASDERAARSAAAENRSDGEDPLYGLQLILWDLAQSHYLAESQKLAGLIQEELNLTLDLKNRGVKQAPFRVLLGTAMPAVLVELGFLNNPAEEERLQSPAYQEALVEALVRAVTRYRAATQGIAPPAEEAVR